MDRIDLDDYEAGRWLHIRTGYPLRWLHVGAVVAAVPAMLTAETRSRAVDHVFSQLWVSYVFYGVLLISSGVALVAVWRPLPRVLDDHTHKVIVTRLICERIGLYGVGGIMICFACTTLVASGWNGLPGAALLVGVSAVLLARARQTTTDVRKLHAVMSGAAERVNAEGLVADPDAAKPDLADPESTG